MLPDTPDVERVLTGPDGVLSAIQKGAVVIDMSSISPVVTERLAKQVAEKGAAMLDAPVSGGEIGAINAALLAAAVLALNDPALAQALDDWRSRQTAAVADTPAEVAP